MAKRLCYWIYLQVKPQPNYSWYNGVVKRSELHYNYCIVIINWLIVDTYPPIISPWHFVIGFVWCSGAFKRPETCSTRYHSYAPYTFSLEKLQRFYICFLNPGYDCITELWYFNLLYKCVFWCVCVPVYWASIILRMAWEPGCAGASSRLCWAYRARTVRRELCTQWVSRTPPRACASHHRRRRWTQRSPSLRRRDSQSDPPPLCLELLHLLTVIKTP